MKDQLKLNTIKFIHTLIWIFMVAVIFYVLYSGIYDRVDIFSWICAGIILLEGLVLLIFRMSCPLTIMARKYSDSTKDNFDIYLPNWLAKYNKQIFTSVYIVGLLLSIYRVI